MGLGTVTVGELLKFLETQDPDTVVRYGFGERFHSDRGDYSNVAYEPKENATIREMLALVKKSLGATIHGYKGGDFKVHEFTQCFIGEDSSVCGDPISQTLLRYWAAPKVPA